MITALQAEAMCLTIRLGHTELSYQIGSETTSPELEGHYRYTSQQPLLTELSEALYNSPLLTLPYGRVRILLCPEYVALAPRELYHDSPSWLISLLGLRGEAYGYASYPISEGEQILTMAIDGELMSFFARQYLNPEYLPLYHSELQELSERSRHTGQGQVMLYLDYDGLTLALLEAKGMVFINRFAYVSPWQAESKEGEVLYYLSLMIDSLGLQVGSLAYAITPSSESEDALATQLRQTLALR